MGPIGMVFRRLGNTLGMTWWAKVETSEPNVTYWFGPFLTRRSLRLRLKGFLEDLAFEGSPARNHSIIRCNRVEPLTINS